MRPSLSVEVVCCGSEQGTPQHNECVTMSTFSTRQERPSLESVEVLWCSSNHGTPQHIKCVTRWGGREFDSLKETPTWVGKILETVKEP